MKVQVLIEFEMEEPKTDHMRIYDEQITSTVDSVLFEAQGKYGAKVIFVRHETQNGPSHFWWNITKGKAEAKE
jgi:hypothetical protein